MWSSSGRQINYGLPSEMGMVGLRDVFFVAPAASFHHSNQHQETTINFDSHSLIGSNPATALGVGVGVGVIPLLTGVGVDDGVLNNSRSTRGGGAVHLWQNQQSQMKKPAIVDHSGGSNLLQGGLGSSASATSATTTCQDCGNQAKKDCSHRRCRSCCKSRGYDCSTHVKSTWVPASRRRERQLISAAAAAAGSSQSISSAKKPKLATSQTTTGSHTSTSNNTPPISFDTGSSHQDAGFKDLPGQVRAPAVFKCVRVTSIDDGEDEYAYQAVVNIGGHVFKGFLYDQGVEEREGFPNISDLHLGAGGGGRNGASSTSPILDPSDVYALSSGGLLGGSSSYGNPIN
ncbi:hypothetical protein ACH5RR_009278 [Cinchona calisaya]|uniref:Uncharacterized protein n=1 Tax=Cinchona calisaya TaxID=153742 RepID=A0ABD3ADU7_9GENT